MKDFLLKGSCFPLFGCVKRKIFSPKINYFLKKYIVCDESSMVVMVVILLMMNVVNYIICASYCSVIMIIVLVVMINYFSKKIY